jgi:hypothetical protein
MGGPNERRNQARGQQTDLGASDVTSLKVKNTSCEKGAKR